MYSPPGGCGHRMVARMTHFERLGPSGLARKLQPHDVLRDWMTREQYAGFLRGGVIELLAHCDERGGIKDIKLARTYLDHLIDFCEKP